MARSSDEKLPSVQVDVSPRRSGSRPDAAGRAGDLRGLRDLLDGEGAVRHAAGDERCSSSGLYELAGQSIDSNGEGDVLGRVVGVEVAADLVRLAVRRGRRREWVVRARLRLLAVRRTSCRSPSSCLGSSITFGPCGIGCVGHVFTSGALLTGTFTCLTGSSGLPVSRSRIQVQPSFATSATADG